jgi:CubicO group peptidase (beta-lactamase class C family)
MKFAAACLAIVLTAASGGVAAPAHAHDDRAQDDRAARVAALAADYSTTAIAAALIRDGRVVWTTVAGVQEGERPADADTLFNVASLAKPVTAELILRLVQAGEIDLDQPLSDTWVEPDVLSDPRHRLLTPRLALSHQTGFPNWRPRNQVLAFQRDPGTAFGYSGEGYDYLAHFAERRTGQDFEALEQSRVFEPMGLTRIAYTWRPWMQDHVAVPENAARFPGASGPGMPGRWSAADNLYVAIDDYAAFTARVAAGDGLSPALAAERLRVHATTQGCPTPAPGCPDQVGMALGWMVLTFGDRRIAMHEGSDEGVSTMAYFDPDRRDGAVVFISGENGTRLVLRVLEIIDPESLVLAGFRAAGVR